MSHSPAPWSCTIDDYGNFLLVDANDEPIVRSFEYLWLNNEDDAPLLANAPELAAENERLKQQNDNMRAALAKLTSDQTAGEFWQELRETCHIATSDAADECTEIIMKKIKSIIDSVGIES